MIEVCTKKWFICLITSVEFWGALIAAIIGGIVAYLIARSQVKSSEAAQEKHRIETIKHEHHMELIRIQLEECGKSIKFLTSLPHIIDSVELISYEVMVKREIDVDEALKTQLPQVELVTDSSFKLLELESSVKICDLDYDTKLNCNKLRKTINSIYETTTLESNEKLLLESGSLEKYKAKKVESIEKANRLVTVVSASFRNRYENLISEYKKTLD